MLQNENFFRNFKHNSVFSLRYCSGCVVAKVFLREMKFLQFMIWLLKLSAVFCGPRHVLRIYAVAKINSEKLKEILPKALVTVQNLDCTYETYILYIWDYCNRSLASYGKIEFTWETFHMLHRLWCSSRVRLSSLLEKYQR